MSFFSFRHPGLDPGSSHMSGIPMKEVIARSHPIKPHSSCLSRLPRQPVWIPGQARNDGFLLPRQPDWISRQSVIKPGMTDFFLFVILDSLQDPAI
jgi:hypothetical protein